MLTLNLHFLFLALSFILLLVEEEGLHVVIYALLAAGIQLFLWVRREHRTRTLNWCHPVPVFVLGYCIVYYQLPFCYLSGYELTYYSSYVIFSAQNISYCVVLALLGLSAFFCGEQLCHLRRRSFSGPPLFESSSGASSYLVRIRTINSLLLCFTILFFLLYLNSIGVTSYLGYSYGAQMVSGVFSSHLGFLFTICLYLLIFFDLTRVCQLRPTSMLSYWKAWDKRVLLVAVITLVPYVLSGDRGAYLQPMALIVAPYFLLVKPMRFWQAAILVVIMAFALVLVGDTRGGTSHNFLRALDARVDTISNPAQWPTMELANSFGTFNIATAYFPDKYSYTNGMKIFYNVAALVPLSSVFTEVEKKNKESDYIFTSALFFTNILTDGTFSTGSGTSSLADLYMDFGPYGIPIILFLWGFFMAWISRRAIATRSAIFVFLYSYYSYVGIYVNRSSFFSGLNNFVWVIIIFYFVNRLYLDKGRSKAPSRVTPP